MGEWNDAPLTGTSGYDGGANDGPYQALVESEDRPRGMQNSDDSHRTTSSYRIPTQAIGDGSTRPRIARLRFPPLQDVDSDSRLDTRACRHVSFRSMMAVVSADKASFSGTVVAVQPRIRLTRSFDERSHTYQGYVLRVDGEYGGAASLFVVALGKAAQAKHDFCAGDLVVGEAEPVADDRTEVADVYKVAKLTKTPGATSNARPPPWLGAPPTLDMYRARGHRRLDAKTFRAKCLECIWGCEMAVEMIIDQWNPTNVRWRRETFCYGPKSCPTYRAGPTRKVPGRKGMSWEEADWVDEQDTSHRRDDE